MGSLFSKKDKSSRSRPGGGTRTDRPRSPDPVPVDVPKFKLLLLGSGESGKSTFYKRLLIKYGRGFADDDRQEFIESIFENTIESIKTLVHQSAFMEEKQDCKYDPSLADTARYIEQLQDDDPITERIAEAIAALWADQGIKNTFELRSHFQVPDSASYFFNRIHELAKESYIPTEEDVLRCRDRTTGVTNETLEIRGDTSADFTIYDVGGQRSERRHWVKIFENVKAVLFVVAISEFDQKCFEDETQNRLDDALDVFKMVANSKHFESTPIVLLFNKTDLFRDKLERGIEFQFGDYQGQPSNYDEICEFMQKKFEQQNGHFDAERIITRFVCAIEEDFGFTDVFDNIVSYYNR